MAKSKANLGDVRQRLNERYEALQKKVRPASPVELAADLIDARVTDFLNKLGINYPIDFSHPPPDVFVAYRQGTHYLEPDGSTDGGSPAVATDEKCLTFKARESGFLVIDHLDFIMEDPIAEGFTITYTFDGEAVNSVKYQISNNDSEIGHWKFGRIVLADGGKVSICVANPNANAGGCFSFEGRMWKL